MGVHAVIGLDRRETVVHLLPSVEVGNAVADKSNGARHEAPFRGGVPCGEKTGFRRSAQRRRRLTAYSSAADERLTGERIATLREETFPLRQETFRHTPRPRALRTQHGQRF